MVAGRRKIATQPTEQAPEVVLERDPDAPYERIATDPPARRHPTVAELEARVRADPRTTPEALRWLDHMDKVRRGAK